jgi:hypothetical protein
LWDISARELLLKEQLDWLGTDAVVGFSSIATESVASL